jgi:hypothetical protein
MRNCWIVFSLFLLGASSAEAGCGLFRCGGCSDPCAAASCGGIFRGHAAISAAPIMGSTTGQTVVEAQQQELFDCGPVTTYRVVMEPKYITESRPVQVTEYRDEVRTRTRVVSRQVPVEVQDYRTITVMVPTAETKTIEYTVLVPQQNEKSVEVVESVPVWNEVTEEYTVRVPKVVDVPEEYSVRVPQLRSEEFTYTAYVPQAQTQTKIHTFTNAVPVTKTRTVQVCRPVTRTQTVTKDYGHWEVRVEEVAAASVPAITYSAPAASWSAPVTYSGVSMGGCGTTATYRSGASVGSCGSCGGCGQVYATRAHGCRIARRCGSCGGCGLRAHGGTGCGGSCGSASGCDGGCGSVGYSHVVYSSPATFSAPAAYSAPVCDTNATYSVPQTQTISRRVWVPNVTTEEVPVVENVMETQEISYTAFEQKTEQIPYECTYLVYAPEQRTGTRQVVDYVNETRTRSRKVVEYNNETRTRTNKQLSYTQRTRTETVPYVTYTTEKRTKEVSFTVNVPETKVEPFTTTRFDTVQEEIAEEYTVKVPVCVNKETQVQVCRMVPKLVPVIIYPCSSAGSQLMNSGSGVYGGNTAGCTHCGGTPTMAPVQGGCASCGQASCATCPR